MADFSRKNLTVVIVNWNVKEHLLTNLKALYASEGDPSFEVIVVDNASTDGSLEAVEKDFPQVRIIANEKNLGFSAACNQGIGLAAPPLAPPLRGGDGEVRHVLLLNPDMRVERDALVKTINYLDQNPDVAVLSGKLIDAAGQPMHHARRFPSLRDQLAVTLKLTRFLPGVMNHYLGKDLDLDKEQPVETVRGSFFAINKTALEKIGTLDQRYFIWFEEVDYCQRVKRVGKVMYVPSIVAYDQVGKSFAKRDLLWKQKHFRKSMLAYFRKWHSFVEYAVLWTAWLLIWPAVLVMSFPPRILVRGKLRRKSRTLASGSPHARG